MAPVDSLPADQQAVLKLLLRRGRSYADIAGMLNISDAAVRERAHGALTALGPPAGDLSTRRRAEIGDWLLGQADADERADTEALVSRSEPARAWAAAVAGELAGLGGRAHAAEGGGSGVPAVPGAEAAAAAPVAAAAGGGSARAASSRPRASRAGGAVLLAFVALAAVIAVVLVTRGGDDDGDAERASSTTSTASEDAAAARVVAQVNLRPPEGGPSPRALGVMQILRVEGRLAINAVFEGIPRPRSQSTGYGIWLSTPGGQRKWLGYVNTADERGRLLVQGRFDENITAYRDVLLTRETRKDPPRPGTIYLRGRVQQAPAQGSG